MRKKLFTLAVIGMLCQSNCGNQKGSESERILDVGTEDIGIGMAGDVKTEATDMVASVSEEREETDGKEESSEEEAGKMLPPEYPIELSDVSPTPDVTPASGVSPTPSASPVPSASPMPSVSPAPSVSPTPSASPMLSASPMPSASPTSSASPAPGTTTASEDGSETTEYQGSFAGEEFTDF